MPVVGMYQKLLPMACPEENWQKTLAKNQLVEKRGGPQNLKEPVVKP